MSREALPPRRRARRTAAALALAAAGLSRGVGAQPATATGSAAAQVVLPLTLTREADLDFGTIAMAADSPGSVTIAALGGAVRYAGGASGVCADACPPPHPARFTVNGEPGRSYQVAVPGQLAIRTADGSGGGGVTVDSLVARSASDPADSGGVLSGRGTDRFEVGGTLKLPAQAPPGHYTTEVPVIVSYP